MTGKVCLTYDDFFVENWLTVRPVFLDFGAKVTFCVSHIHTLTTAQIDGLHQLQDDGHEIACHSRNHERPVKYIDAHGLDQWRDQDVVLAINDHRERGFPATSFAMPFHRFDARTRSVTQQLFRVTRGGGPRAKKPYNFDRRVYTTPKNFVHNLTTIDFQDPAAQPWDVMEQVFMGVKSHAGTAVFCGHDIRETQTGPGLYQTHHDLEKMLTQITAQGLGYATLTDMG